jgi:putative endonuclease
MWYFYILQSQKDFDYFYKGSTGNLEKRLVEHNAGETASIRPYLPFRIVYYEAYVSEEAARLREHAVKQSGSISVPLLRRVKESLRI